MPACGRCPICRREVAREGAAAWPFCSERCRLIDLGRWIAGDYRIPGEPAAPPEERGGGDGEGER